MLVHVRLTVPTHLVEPVLGLVADNPAVTNVVHVPHASVKPKGDLVQADIAREAASSLLDDLADLGLTHEGGVVLLPLTATPFDAADEADDAADGSPEDAVIWEVLLEGAKDAVRPTVVFHCFLLIAVLLAAVAVLTDSSVLVVGSMVVGPDFAVVAAICTGLVFLDRRLTLDGLKLLIFGFTFVVLAAALLIFLTTLPGWITPEMVDRPRPQTDFIWNPNLWSFVVAVLAGAVGVLALSTDKSEAMVGVFISVTTVPAAGNLALGIAVWNADEMLGSLGQLGLNVLGMVMAGALTLLVQRLVWVRLDRLTQPLFRHRPTRARRLPRTPDRF